MVCSTTVIQNRMLSRNGLSVKSQEAFMEKQGFVSNAHRKKPHVKPTRGTSRDPMLESRLSGPAETMSLLIRNHRRDCLYPHSRYHRSLRLANIVYNIRRLLFLERSSPAVLVRQSSKRSVKIRSLRKQIIVLQSHQIMP